MHSIDREHLARFTLGNVELEHEILELFVQETDRLRCQLASASDGESWRRCCHSIKGSARGVGAFELGSLAAEAEALCWPQEPATLARHCAALEAAHARVRRAFSEAFAPAV